MLVGIPMFAMSMSNRKAVKFFNDWHFELFKEVQSWYAELLLKFDV